MSQDQNVQIQSFKKRTGLLQVRVKSNHIIRCKDGVRRQFEVKDVEHANYQNCSKVVVNLTTNTTYPSYGELLADTPDAATMRREEQSMVWAYWSEDTEDYLRALEQAERDYQIAKSKDDKAKKRVVERPEVIDYSKIIGLLATFQE